MVERDSKGVLEVAKEPKPTRRRDRFLPIMVERQQVSGIADRARNVLAKHHHAVADIGPSTSHYEGVIDDRRRSDRNDRNIDRIRSSQ